MKFLSTLKITVMALLLVTLAFLASCSSNGASGKPAEPAPVMMVPVNVATVTTKTVPVQVRVIGNGEAYSTVDVKSQVEGRVERVYFSEGENVKKGQLLFSIDSRPFQSVVNQAEANRAKDVALAKNAEAQAGRYEELYKSGIVSKNQYDQFHTTAASLEASVNADQAAVETGKIQLGYTSIYAPINGRTGNLMVHPGNTIKAGDATLVVINQITPIYVDISVPEQYLADIKKYLARGKLRVEAILPQQEDRPEVGQITFVNNSVDRASGTILLKGTFPNTDNRLWPGQFVNVVLTLAQQPFAIVVPTQAVQTGQAGQFVYVVKDDHSVDLRPVVPGSTFGGDVVIQKGLRPGEKVVTDGQLMLYPGAKVEIKTGLKSDAQGAAASGDAGSGK